MSADLGAALRALERLYTYPGVRALLAPSGSLGSIADEVEEALAARPVERIAGPNAAVEALARDIVKQWRDGLKAPRAWQLDPGQAANLVQLIAAALAARTPTTSAQDTEGRP